ncbi:two-component system regulatory protein YycI [Bacillus sp. EB600]|uniref:two-component system regulatory protein YycI n=1 Tax=Bacillus sp. EB600 TaxID=2806345 RepID=UPI00210F057F|nr:two-component system regulatory protein YycI [Bacillus sp. EB600]MCQ6280243.1 two-component system regulatory protein YycI [Bacillus sp. EB600]
MDWSKIKTIFILTFLILDVYLFYQFMKIRDANKFEFITEATFEDKLKADEIKYIELPKAPIKDQYISAKPNIFTKEDIAKLKGQTAYLKDTKTIEATLEKPVQLDSKFDASKVTSFLKENVLYGDHYKFFSKNDKKDTITYYQQFDDKVFYKNRSGMVTLNLNKENQVFSYDQTYLVGIEKMNKQEDVLPPLNAIETLHQKGLLKPKSEITTIELGYSTLVQLAASQVLAPTWRIVVNDKDNLFVNAFEGQVINFKSDENKVVE